MGRAGELIIRLKQVKGVRGDEALGFGKADLYANLVLGDVKMSSQTVNNGGSDTSWNEEFSVKLAAHMKLELYEKLRIYIYDSDYWGDSRRGTAWIDLKDLMEGRTDDIPDTEYPVTFHGEQKGVVIVGFTFKPSNMLPVVQPLLTTVEDDNESTIDQLIHKIQDLKPFHRKPKKKVVPAAEGSEENREEKERKKVAEHTKEHKPWASESESSSSDED